MRFHIPIKGFRTEDVTLVTTLLSPKLYTRIALAKLYELRWHAEIDLKHLKTTMQIEHLPSKTPEMVRKDFYVHLLAYNLIRTVQLEASSQHGVDPLSLKQQFSTCLRLPVYSLMLQRNTEHMSMGN